MKKIDNVTLVSTELRRGNFHNFRQVEAEFEELDNQMLITLRKTKRDFDKMRFEIKPGFIVRTKDAEYFIDEVTVKDQRPRYVILTTHDISTPAA